MVDSTYVMWIGMICTLMIYVQRTDRQETCSCSWVTSPQVTLLLMIHIQAIYSLLMYVCTGNATYIYSFDLCTCCSHTGGAVGGCVSDPQHQMRGLQDTQLTQLEHLITQQRKAHQRMRHVLREAEKVSMAISPKN